jgi:hypothetical protein
MSKELPHSLEAEEYLIGSCMMDGADMMPKCIAARIKPQSFYDPKLGAVFETLSYLHERGFETDIGVVAEELKARKRLSEVGGFPFLAQISSRVPTTARAVYFLEQVRQQAGLREAIRALSSALELAHDTKTDVDELFASVRDRLDRVQIGSDVSEDIRGAMSFELPAEHDANSLLGKNRYIGRGDGAIIVSSSGMGKSVLQIQWAVCAALGWPFAGIATQGKLTSLVVQSEDSDGDIGEVIFSLKIMMKLTPEQCLEVDKRVLFVRDKLNRGPAFIVRLRALVNKVKPDLVWLNPLHAFAGCDIADARELGNFLRGGLNGVNKEDRFAYMIVHHTPKPMTGKGVQDKKWHEFMYDAAGSAELVNWARAVITLKPTETEGEFNLILAKRGKRAEVTIEVPGNGDGIKRLEITTKLPIQHSSRTLKIEGRTRQFHAVYWEDRKPDAAKPVEHDGKQGGVGRYSETYDDATLVVCYPPQSDEGHSFSAVLRFAAGTCGVTKATLSRRQKELKAAELIEQMEDLRWRRTASGDALAAENLRARL